ncbi:MAG: DNA polymerase III subunit beta [Gammaproteobacteria bacterium]|nr:MAG: DNA polymerase III subunit beta [Gammaproteobacteria bacterium]
MITVKGTQLSVTATDMEVELVAKATLDQAAEGETTVPAKKLADICRALPADAEIQFVQEENRVVIRAGRSRFTLATIDSADFPNTEAITDGAKVEIGQGELKQLIELTGFAMAQQDVRYYLNGLLLEIETAGLRAVATDGHRLAMAVTEAKVEGAPEENRQVIVPRKAVMELQRLLHDEEGAQAKLTIGRNAVQVELASAKLTSKLIDGSFPDYTRVIPDLERCDKKLSAGRIALRESLARVSILSNEKYRAVRLLCEEGTLRVQTNNPDQEEAEDEIEVTYSGESLEIGFNVSYLLDALAALPTEEVEIHLTDSASSCLMLPAGARDCQYVVMPMRL